CARGGIDYYGIWYFDVW
nr:immunoglobulin heavy chain junction region [Mus musculus]